MKLKNILTISLIIFALVNYGCSDDDDPTITVKVNGEVIFEEGDDFYGDIDGDFFGDGGSGTRTFSWQNSLATADYNADITATTEGVFNMIVKDSNGNIVLNRTLEGGREPDSFDGVTSPGTSGIWTVNITLTDFNGDGSFSLSEGD